MKDIGRRVESPLTSGGLAPLGVMVRAGASGRLLMASAVSAPIRATNRAAAASPHTNWEPPP
jgi:hypothetical protein